MQNITIKPRYQVLAVTGLRTNNKGELNQGVRVKEIDNRANVFWFNNYNVSDVQLKWGDTIHLNGRFKKRPVLLGSLDTLAF